MARIKKISKKNIELRGRLWPDLDPDDLWDRSKHDGFITIPRTLPIIMNIIDDLTKGKPASKVYLALWGKTFDEMYVSLQNADTLAFQSGLTGQRAARTWKDRMKALASLGFIKIAAGARGELSHAVILNPHFVVRRLHDAKAPGLTEAAFNTLMERTLEIGAEDFDQVLPEKAPPIEKAKPTITAPKRKVRALRRPA